MAKWIPEALHRAARTFDSHHKMVGEILIAVCAGKCPDNFTDVQKYIYDSCFDEIAKGAERRMAEAQRRRIYRAKKGGNKNA